MNMFFTLISFRFIVGNAVKAFHESPEIAQVDDVGFMQVAQRVDKQAVNSSVQQARRTVTPVLAAIRPVIWMHTPKTGSGLFLNFLRLPYLCDHDPTFQEVTEMYWTQGATEAFCEEHCAGSFTFPEVRDDQSGYSFTLMGDSSAYNQLYKGHGFSMFRQPEQRLISQYLFDGEELNNIVHEAMFPDRTSKPSLLAYAHILQGMTVKMITRTGGMPEWLPGPVTSAETELAVSRVEEAFPYVGITDRWDLSMCLLHAMFGGNCVASDFTNTRPGPNNTDEPYDTSALEGFVDVHDGAVYAEAVRVFDERIALYQVSMASCEMCFKAATKDAIASGKS